MKSWLDGVLATPVIGLQLNPVYKTALAYPMLLAGFLDDLLEEKHPVSVAQTQMAGLQVTFTDSGHILRFDVNNAVADFSYQLQGQQSPGELPALKDVKLRPYCEIAEELISLLGAAAETLADHGSPLVCNRFGLVARASLADKSLPPGVSSIKQKFVGQWNHRVAKLDSTALVMLAERDGWVDRCHHKLTFDETTQPGQVGLVLDWQRVLKEPVALQKGGASKFLNTNLAAGMSYFERIADGGFDDE